MICGFIYGICIARFGFDKFYFMCHLFADVEGLFLKKRHLGEKLS